jgi:DNA modification methylase
LIKAYVKDAKGLPEVADNSIQLCITSPPNYILRIGEPDNMKNYPVEFKQKLLLHDYSSFAVLLHQLISAASEAMNIQFIEMIKNIEQKLKPGGVLILNIGNLPVKSNYDLFLTELSIIYPYYMIEETVRCSGLRLHNEYLAANTVDGKTHLERWFVFSKGTIKENNEVTIPIPLYSKIETVKSTENLEVVTPFSQKIVSLFIKKYSCKHDWTLDPYAGTGTVALASAKLRRNSVIYERNIKVWETLLTNLASARTTVKIYKKE